MKKIIIIILIMSVTYAQNIGNIFSQESIDIDPNSMQLNQDFDLTSIKNLTYTPVEGSINPDLYILGPGDLLGINIISTKNITLPIRINPVGEIMIPSVGVINVSGISLSDVKTKIKDYVHNNSIKNAIVNVTLMDVRRFKIQVLGAVHNPGYIHVTPIDKVYDAILQSGGVQKFAHPTIITLHRANKEININLRDFLTNTDLTKNISLIERDIIFVPYNEYALNQGFNKGFYNVNPITVFGFVNQSGIASIIKYYPGYTARDYIAMAGGTKGNNSSFPIGNMGRTVIYRADGTKIKTALNETILPGDLIEVPPSLMSQIVGNDGIIRTLAAVISSAYLIYRYVEDQKN